MNSISTLFKRLYLADKAPINAAVVGGLIILASRAGLHLNASDTAYLASGVGLALGLLVQGKQSAAKSAAKPVAPPVAPLVIHAATAPVTLSPAPSEPSPAVVEEAQDTVPPPAS